MVRRWAALLGESKAAAETERTIANLGKVMGPPWTADQKMATLAALLLLACKQTSARL